MVITLLDKSTIDSQVKVYHAAFNKQAPFEEVKRQWIKKHYENPIENSLIFGAFEEGELVGLNAYLPSCYKLNGGDVYVLQSCESGVLPSQQGKGIWGKIVRYAVDYIAKHTRYVAIIGFPNYRNSYPGFKKMGWKTLYEMNNLILVNNVKFFSKSLFGNKKLLQFLARVSVVLRTPTFFCSLFQGNLRVKECEMHLVLWNDNPEKLTINHYEEWLNWKADYKMLKSLAVYQGKEIIASCIYGIDHFEGNEVVRLDHLSFSENSKIGKSAILSKLLRFFKKERPNAAFVRTWTMPGSEQTKLYKKLWFLRSSHPNPFIITESEEKLGLKDWSLSFFDLD